MVWRLLWALMILILSAACAGRWVQRNTAHPIIIETPAVSATPYITSAPTTPPTRTASSPSPTRTPRATGTPATLNPANKVNINAADAETLARLPHIGPVIAQRIVSYRQEHGPFSRIEEIQNVKGIGAGIFEAIRALITVGK